MKQGRGIGGMSRRTAAWLAWSLCLLCVVLAVASLILARLNGGTLGEIFIFPGIVTFTILTVPFSVVGALITSHRPENAIGWIFLAEGFCYGLLSAGDQYAIYALLTNPGSLPLGAEASWLGQWIWAPGLGLILVFLPLLFPDGHPPSHRWRPVGWLGGLSIGLAVVSSAILLWPERGPALVTGDESPSHVVDVLVVFVAVPMLFVAGLGAVISLLVRFRRARGVERPGARDHHAAGADDAFLERADDGLVDGITHPEIVCVDEQQAGIGGVSQEAVRSGGIPCVHRHLATPFQKVLPLRHRHPEI
jgi:hypothetical protein